MERETSTINSSKIIYFCLSLLFILLPFSATLNTFLRYKLNLGFLSFWKEVLIGIVFCLFIWKKEYWVSFYKSNKRVLLFTLIFLGIGGLSLLYGGKLGFGELAALRLDFLPLVSLMAGLGSSMLLTKSKQEKLINTLIYSSSIAIVIGLFIHLLIGNEALTWIGYRMDWSTFYAGESLAFCQRIENSEICRFQGLLSGPNQMGSFLIMLIGLTLWKKPKHFGLIISLFTIGLLLTLSRSAYFGFIVLISISMLLLNLETVKKYWKGLLGASVISGILFLAVFGRKILLVLNRPESNSEHLRLWIEGWEFWMQSFWIGNGIGSVGPASRYTSFNELIPESWFLQIAGEFGIVGLIVFIAWYMSICLNLFKNKQIYLCLVWVALLIPLNLLHVFESSSLVIGLGIITGLSFISSEESS